MKYLSLLMIFIILFISSCSMRRTMFKYADWLACNRLNSYFDLNAKQKKAYCQNLSKHIDRLKRENLPALLQTTERAMQDSEHPLSLDIWLQYKRELIDLQRAAWAPAIDDTIFLFENLGPKQISQLQEKIAKDGKALTELAQVKAARFPRERQEKIKDYMNNFVTWLGPLTEEQKQLFFHHFDLPQSYWQDLWQQRHKGQQEFISFITGSHSHEEKYTRLLNGRPRLSTDVEPADTVWNNFLRDFLATLTPLQRAHFRAELSGWYQDLQEFARTSG